MPASIAENIRKYNLISQNHGHLTEHSHKIRVAILNFTKEFTPQNYLPNINSFCCLSKDCFFNPELRAEAYSTSLRHFGYHTHTACRISTPREHWVRLRMTYGNTKFHQSTEHRVNCQGEWLESTLHSSAVGRPLGQHPKKQFTCTKVAQLFAYSSHDNQ